MVEGGETVRVDRRQTGVVCACSCQEHLDDGEAASGGCEGNGGATVTVTPEVHCFVGASAEVVGEEERDTLLGRCCRCVVEWA